MAGRRAVGSCVAQDRCAKDCASVCGCPLAPRRRLRRDFQAAQAARIFRVAPGPMRRGLRIATPPQATCTACRGIAWNGNAEFQVFPPLLLRCSSGRLWPRGSVPLRAAFSETFRPLGPNTNVNDYRGSVPLRAAFSETFRPLGPNTNVNDYRGSAKMSWAIKAYHTEIKVGTLFRRHRQEGHPDRKSDV